MHYGCDVCQNIRPEANLHPRILTRVFFGENDHTVVLCKAHRHLALRSGVTSLGELRDLYREPSGRRSYIPRRSSSPSEAESDTDRRQGGRRSTDA